MHFNHGTGEFSWYLYRVCMRIEIAPAAAKSRILSAAGVFPSGASTHYVNLAGGSKARARLFSSKRNARNKQCMPGGAIISSIAKRRASIE